MESNVDVQFIGITMEDGYFTFMQFVTCEYGPNGEVRWEREATEEAVNAEIQRAFSAPEQPHGQPDTWRFIKRENLPESREHRDAWRDDGTSIVVDETKV